MNAVAWTAPGALPLEWRRHFIQARAAFCSDDLATARSMFDELAAAVPSSLEIRLYSSWTRARLAGTTTQGQREALEDLARRALGEGSSLALPLCILAHAAARQGDLRLARRLFRRAAEADPALIDARRGERMLNR